MTRPAPMFNDNKLKLGIFSANCSSGMAVTKVKSAGSMIGQTTSN